MYENLIIAIEYGIPAIVILLIAICWLLASMSQRLETIERKLSEFKASREDSAAERKRDSKE
jgi:hypothetical protein